MRKNKESLPDQWDSKQKQKASVLPTPSVLQEATNSQWLQVGVGPGKHVSKVSVIKETAEVHLHADGS